ncbi:hypothetical protein [Solidesulfovibrio sp.]
MKKFIVFAAALSLALSVAPAFAKGKKAAPKKTWDCKVGTNSVMTATVGECMKMGGLVANYPGPDKAAAPKAKKGKK